ncbi:MAG: hypothetical protein ACOVOX_00080, partial [Burkholderiaceae bacterium]
MTTLLISLIVLAAVIFWYIRIRPGQARDTNAPEHVDTVIGWQPRATRLMTAAEQQAYDTLRQALPEYMVLS